MAENYKGGPVGLRTLAVAVAEEANTLEEVHEPFLIQEAILLGLLKVEFLLKRVAMLQE